MEKLLKMLIVSVLLTISASLSAQVSTWDGSWEPWTNGTGTEQDPFLIENAKQLAYLAYRVNNGLDAGGGHVSNHDYHYKLMVDVNLNGSETFQWTPIGYWTSDADYQCFGGHFDGNGHAVSNLYINSSANRVGFFGYADGVTIENLSVSGEMVATTGSYGGGIVGYANGMEIRSCNNNCNVSRSSSGNYSYLGGIVGQISGNTSIASCYNTGNVSYSGSYSYLGGIVGQISGNTSVVNCYNTGNVSYSGSYSYSVGGIVGRRTGSGYMSITNCYNIGNVNNGGGIMGSGSCNVTNCYYLNTCGGNNNHGGEPKTDVYMKSLEFLEVLNNGSCAWEQDVQPYQNQGYPILTGIIVFTSTSDATNITQSHATLHGTIEVENTSVQSQGFEYKKSSDSNYQTVNVSGSGEITKTLTNLIPNTQYTYRTFCTTNGCGTDYGQEKTFTTLSISVTTNNASDVTQTHATLNGNLNIGDANVSAQGFEYKKTSDNTWQTINVSGSGDISTTLSNLTFNTQYRFRTFCTAQGCEPVYGQEKTFTTQSISVTTSDATSVTQTHATLHGVLNAGDANVSAQGFEYKKTSDDTWQTINVSGSGDISTTLSNLTFNAQYIFRTFCIVQGCEPVYGQEKTFTTQNVTVTTYAATNLTESSATLNGLINAGDAAVTDKGFKYWPSSEPQNVTTISVANTSAISATVYGLTVNTTYSYRAFAFIDNGTYQGDIQTFELSWLNADTICVYDADMLRWVSEMCNSGVTFAGKYIKLMNNIELPLNVPNNMTSIGIYPNRPFKGTFDGNGLLITNLYIDQPNTPYQGFFGYTQNANLFNVGLVNITASGRNYTGGMVAYAQNTHMRDCYVNGGTLYALSYCGGLVGYQEQGTNSIISGCYNTCTVSGNHYVGGLVGFSNYGTVRNSYVAAPVTGQGDAIGGIIGGANEVLIYNSYFSTEITGQTVAIGENNFKDGEGLTNAQMRDPQFVATMNQGLVTPVWKADYTDPLNNGFPILMWQYSSAEPCDAPENLTFTLGETSVTLNWTASPNANHYIVEYGKTNEPAHTENTPQNQFSFNIEPDVVYYWRVKSVCPYGESNFVSGDNINTDVEEINDVSKHLQLYPNPANDLVIIRLDDLNASLKYMDVYDMIGRKVMSANIDGQTHEFSVANLRSGVYYIRVQTDNELYATLKMVVR